MNWGRIFRQGSCVAHIWRDRWDRRVPELPLRRLHLSRRQVR